MRDMNVKGQSVSRRAWKDRVYSAWAQKGGSFNSVEEDVDTGVERREGTLRTEEANHSEGACENNWCTISFAQKDFLR